MITKEMLKSNKKKYIILGSIGIVILLLLYLLVSYIVHIFIHSTNSENNNQIQSNTTTTGNESSWYTNWQNNYSWTNILWGPSQTDTWGIVSRSTLREKLKHVPVSEVNWVPTQAQ